MSDYTELTGNIVTHHKLRPWEVSLRPSEQALTIKQLAALDAADDIKEQAA